VLPRHAGSAACVRTHLTRRTAGRAALVLLARPDGGPSRDAVKRAIIASGVVPVLAAQMQGSYRGASAGSTDAGLLP
jgi:hypothetical protein